MNPRILMSLIPVAVFLVLSRVAPPVVSISGGFLASTIVFVLNRQDRLIGALTAFGFVVVALSAAVGIIWNSEKAYLASGPLSDFLFIGLYLGSIAMKRPLIGGIARELWPAVAGNLPHDARIFVQLSLAWAAYDFAHGLGRTYMLMNLDVDEYVILSRLFWWPINAMLLALTVALIYREARRLEPSPVRV